MKRNNKATAPVATATTDNTAPVAVLEPQTEPKAKKARKSKYQAKERGLLTEKSGFQRHGWEGSTIITDKERALLEAAWDLLIDRQDDPETGGDWGFSDLTVPDLADAAGLEVSQVWGALSVLVAKGLAFIERVERLVPNKQGQLTKKERTALFHLRPRVVEVLGR